MFKQLSTKLKTLFKKKQYSLDKILEEARLKNILCEFHCTLPTLLEWFPKDKAIIGPIDKQTLNLLTCFEDFGAVQVSLTMGEHEWPKVHEIMTALGYVLPISDKPVSAVMNQKETATTLCFSMSRCCYAMGDMAFSQCFDAFFSFVTNDSRLMSSLQNHAFEMSPPWLVFDDYVFAYRNHYWRWDWKNFWNRLSEEEKQAYFAKFDAPEEWVGWLSAEEFVLS